MYSLHIPNVSYLPQSHDLEEDGKIKAITVFDSTGEQLFWALRRQMFTGPTVLDKNYENLVKYRYRHATLSEEEWEKVTNLKPLENLKINAVHIDFGRKIGLYPINDLFVRYIENEDVDRNHDSSQRIKGPLESLLIQV